MRKKITVITFSIAIVLILGIVSSIYLFNMNKEASTTDEISTNSLPPATLTFYFQGQEPNGAADVIKEIERQTKNILNAKLNFKWLDGNQFYEIIYSDKKSSIDYDAISYFGLQYAKNTNLPMDITKLFPKYVPNYYSKFSKEELASGSVNGRLYMVPSRMPSSNRYVASIREDLRVKYGLPEIKSYEGMTAYIQAIAAKEKNTVPILLLGNASSVNLFANANGYATLDNQLGLVYRWNDPKMKIVPWEKTTEYYKIISMINIWKKAGGDLNYLDRKNPVHPTEKNILTGKYACILGDSPISEYINSQMKTSGIIYKDYSLYSSRTSERSNSSTGFAINSKSPNAARVLMFIEWLQANQDNYDLLMNGIKGRDYELVDGQIKPLAANNTQNTYFNWQGGGSFTNIDYTRTSVGTPKDYIEKYLKNIRDNTQYPPHTGFNLDTSKINIGLYRYRVTSSSSLEQSISRDTFTPDMIGDYIERQNQGNGINKIIAQVQYQLDQWRLKNKK